MSQPYAVVMFTSSSMAASAAASYRGELGQGFRVKRLSSTSSQSSTPTGIKSLQVSPKPPKSTGKQAPNESLWKDANTPSGSPSAMKDSRLAPLKTPPSSSYDDALSAANALLEQSGGGSTSPVVEKYMRVEKMGAEQSSTATIEKLLYRVKFTEKALAHATETVASLNAEVATLSARNHLNEMHKKDEEASWVMESMELKIQVSWGARSERRTPLLTSQTPRS